MRATHCFGDDVAHEHSVQKLLQAAATEKELAIGVLFAANLTAQTGDNLTAVQLLALASCVPVVAGRNFVNELGRPSR